MNELHKQYITLENKSILKISGIENVIKLTDTEIYVTINEEILEIKGYNLKAEKLSVECGELVVNGNITSLKYQENNKKTPLLKRLFK